MGSWVMIKFVLVFQWSAEHKIKISDQPSACTSSKHEQPLCSHNKQIQWESNGHNPTDGHDLSLSIRSMKKFCRCVQTIETSDRLCSNYRNLLKIVFKLSKPLIDCVQTIETSDKFDVIKSLNNESRTE